MMNESDKMNLESDYVDSHGIAAVLSALADICREKADHVSSAGCVGNPDPAMARAWNSVARAIERCANTRAVQESPL